MEIGLRVVRGPDWVWEEQDGGEGNVGTVVRLGKDGDRVSVYWDSGKQSNCRAGQSGKFDLRVYDNAPTGVKHSSVTCDNCRQSPIAGTRWKCADCANYDLCSPCYMSDVHFKQHSFLRFDESGADGVPVGKRSSCTKQQPEGFFPGARVTRGRDWNWGERDGGNGQVGTLTELTTFSGVERAGAKIAWKRSRSLCRIGHMGSVDLKCSTPATGPSYYRECLAKVGEIRRRPVENRLKVGDRVSVCLDVEVLKAMAVGHGGWVDGMERFIGKVGKISEIDADGDVHINYGLQKLVFHPDSVTKVASFKEGDKVRIKSDKQLVQNLQDGHGGWNEAMSRALGKEGKILDVDSDGDALVLVGSDTWLMNPAALEDLSGGEATSRPGDTSPNSSGDKADILKMLLQEAVTKGGGIDPGDRLVKASSDGNFQDVREILEANPGKIDHKTGGKTALQVACHQGEAEIVKYLVGKGADKDIKDEQDYTALHHAAYGDRTGETVTVMLNTGTNVNVCDNKNKSTPLHLAVNQGNKAGVKALVASQHCDVNCQDLAGDTPLHDAISKGKNTIVDLILGSQVLDVSVCNSGGFNPLHHACKKGNLHAVQKLADRYPDLIEIPKEDGFTALHLSAINNHKDIARYILFSGHCDVNSRNNQGQTSLALAVIEEYKAIIKLLIEHGADVNAADEDGDTPLHLAVMDHAVGNTRLRGLFKGIGLSLPDGAKTDKHTGSAIAVYLALHGADINFYNHAGKTPLDLCQDGRTANLIKRFARNFPRLTCSSGQSTFIQPPPQLVLSQSVPRPAQAPRGTDTSSPGPSVPDPLLAASATATAAQRQRTTQDSAESGETDCINCSKNTATVTFDPCGHKVTCSVCSLKLNRCLKCNAAIQQKTPQVPSEIKARGPRARLAFENALKTGKVKVYRARIMLIGQDRAGKTSLKKTLLGLPFDPKQQSTEGIEVDPSKCSVDVDQVKNWQRTDAKLDVSHFETDLVKMVAEKLKEEEEKEEEEQQQRQQQQQQEEEEEKEEEKEEEQQQKQEEEKQQQQQQPQEQQEEEEEGQQQQQQREQQQQQQQENQCKQTEKSLLTQEKMRNKKWKNWNNKDTDMDANQAEKTQEVRGDPLMASHSKNREPVTPDLNIDPVLPSAKFIDRLVQYLEGLNLQTDGTTIEHHMTLELWDFAGQHLYYASYPAFLSPRALYMLVYNLSKGLKDTAQPYFRQGVNNVLLGNPNQETNLENLLSWLVSVNTMCSSNPEMDGDKDSRKDPPVFIVGTHADKPHQDIKEMEVQIQEEIVEKDYEGHVIRPFFSIDNTQGMSGKGAGELRKRMIEVLKQEPYMGEEVPLRWFNFEKVVQALVAAKTYYLNLEQLQTIIQKVCFIEDEDEVVTMLDFYHDLGMIVKHRDTVVLQAQWLIDVFKQLITIRSFNEMERGCAKWWKAMEETGELNMELVDNVFSKFCQEGLTRQDILNMMEQFGLIVKFATSPTDERYFVPCQLKTPPEDLYEIELTPSDPCPLYLHFLGGFVPHGLFSQLVSRCTRWCSESGFKRPPNLFDGAAWFFIEKEFNHRLILICKKSFIEIILEQMKQKPKVPLAKAKAEEVINVVRRFLEDTMRNLSSELPWLRNMTYEFCVECPYCLKEEKPCRNHGEVSCTHEDCMCLLQVPPDGLPSYCPKSYSYDAILRLPRLEKWFPIKDMSKEEVQISAESKKVSSCFASQLPESTDHPADQKRTNIEVPFAHDDGLDQRISKRTNQEFRPSTSLEAQSHSGNSGKTLKVTLLANEWRSTKGGLSTINRTLAILLAKHSNVDATLLVPQFECGEEDKRTAQSHNISIREAQRRPACDPLDWLSCPPRDLTIDIVIGHGAKLGKQAQFIRENHHCKWVQVVHTEPEELAMYKDYGKAIAKGEEKKRAEIDLCKLADLVVAVGPKLAETFSSRLHSSHVDVFQLTPGIFEDFADVRHPERETTNFKVLTFGRGDSEDLKLKGYDIAANAIAQLKDSSYRLIFVGAPDGKQDAVAETLLQTGISKNQLIVRSFEQDKERLKEFFYEADVAIMTSRTEGFGLTALEAMSAGLPILVSGNSGLGQALRGLPFGMSFLVESEEPKEWAKAIGALRQKSRTQRLQEVEVLRGFYEGAYNWEKQCTSLVERMWKMVYGVDTPTKSHVKSRTGDDAVPRQTASDTHFPQGAKRSPGYKAPVKNGKENAAVGQMSHGVERAPGDKPPVNNCEEDAAIIRQMADRELFFNVLQGMMRDARKATSNADLSVEMKKISSDKGFMISDNQGEGNCMFHALSEQLYLVKEIQIPHQELRHEVVHYLRNNPNLPDGTELLNFVDGYSSWDSYLTNMAVDGTWGDHVILHGVANRFETCIHVISSLSHHDDAIINPDRDVTNSNRLVLGHVNELHYVSLIPLTPVVIKEGSPSDDELEGLSRRIKDWKPLGRRLKFDEAMLHGFQKDNDEWSERAYAMLITWKERKGSAATYQVLFEALCHEYVNRTDLAKKICCSSAP